MPFDLNISLSTRAKFLEKHIPVNAIFTGMSLHVYLPTFFAKTNSTATFKPGEMSEDKLLDYNFSFKGDMVFGCNSAFASIYKNIPGFISP